MCRVLYLARRRQHRLPGTPTKSSRSAKAINRWRERWQVAIGSCLTPSSRLLSRVAARGKKRARLSLARRSRSLQLTQRDLIPSVKLTASGDVASRHVRKRSDRWELWGSTACYVFLIRLWCRTNFIYFSFFFYHAPLHMARKVCSFEWRFLSILFSLFLYNVWYIYLVLNTTKNRAISHLAYIFENVCVKARTQYSTNKTVGMKHYIVW